MGSKRKRSAREAPIAAPAAKKQQKWSPTTISKAIPIAPLDSSPFLDDPKAADLKREVELYDLLANEDSALRLNAANAIVSGLLKDGGVEELTLQRHLERRLFRGLASGRKAARLGFSVVITEILSQLFGEKSTANVKYTGLTFEKVLGFLVAKTKPDGDLSGQEEKDHYLGLLFGLQSFVRAKVLFENDEMWNVILGKLLELAKKKPWIREECGWVIVEAVAQMSQGQAEFTLESLYVAGLALSPEGVGIWIKAKGRFPTMKFPNKPWGPTGNPLDRLQSLAKALKESSPNDDGPATIKQAKQTGNWNPQLHFVWGIVLSQFATAAQQKQSGVASDFENFWKVAVDENLFSTTASRERKFWGFLLFQTLLQNHSVYAELIPYIFSRNLVRCLINHVQEKDRFLHLSADKSLKILTKAVDEEPRLLVSILPGLIGGHGAYNFDKITKTKTIEKLLSKVDEEFEKGIIDILVAPALLVESADAIRDAEMRRVLLGDYFLSLIRQLDLTKAPLNSKWIREDALPVMARIAYGKNLVCMPILSEKTRVLFQNRLMSVFGYLLSNISGYIYPCELLQKFSPDAVDMDKNILDAKDRALSIMEKILKKSKKASDQGKPPLQALALLYSLTIFQLYNGESEAISILDELKICYDKLIRHKDTEGSDIEASEVLVELLLSFISKPSALLRKVTQHVFQAFMGQMTGGGLKLMTDVLESNENLRGQQEIFDQESDNDIQEDEDSDDEEMDSDVEVIDMDGDEGDFNGHLNDGSDDDIDEDDDSAENDNEEAQKFNDALAKALGTRRLDQDLQEEESDSDTDMTDSEMMALDSKLVEIFSQRKKIPNKKKEQKDAKETMVNFKSRVLDLLEIYVKRSSSNPLAYGLLLPLLQLIRTTKAKQLAEKAQNVIFSFTKAAKKEIPADIEMSEQLKSMRAIHLEASKDPSHLFAKAASAASLLIAQNMYRVNKGSVKKIVRIYGDTMIVWVGKEVRMQAVFFEQFNNWCQSHANSKTEEGK